MKKKNTEKRPLFCARGAFFYKRASYSLTLSLAVMIFFFAPPAFAKIGAAPAELELEVSAGESYNGFFKIVNYENNPIRVKVYLGDWDRGIKGENHFFKPGKIAKSCADWITFSPAMLELKAGETEAVRFTIDVPEKALGTHWAIFFAEREMKLIKPPRKKGQRRVFIPVTERLGIKIYQSSPETAKKRGEITNVAFSLPKEGEPLKAIVEFKNTGNVHLKTGGRLEFRDDSGQTKAEIKIKEFPILPGAKRQIELTYEEKLTPGEYTGLTIMDYGGERLVAGEASFKIE